MTERAREVGKVGKRQEHTARGQKQPGTDPAPAAATARLGGWGGMGGTLLVALAA